MQNKKDLLQAHRLMTQRASQALILGEPDTAEAPLRRLNFATTIGVMLSILVLAGFGIWGLLKPGGASGLQAAGVIIVEKESGARYVWCTQDTLCPVENFVSARLLAGSGQVSVKLVSRSSLKGFQRGGELGIPGAPNTLPSSGQLQKGPWSACVKTDVTQLSASVPIVTLQAGKDVGGQTLAPNRAVAVKASGQTWLLVNGQRLLVNPQIVASFAPDAVPIAAKWLNVVPQGRDFGVPVIDGLGNTTTGPQGGGRVGQIFQAVDPIGGGTKYYVLLSDGLQQITPAQAELLEGDPMIKAAYPGQTVAPIKIAAGAVSNVRQSSSGFSAGMPAVMPQVQPFAANTPLCMVYRDASGKTPGELTIGGSQLPQPPGTANGSLETADQLSIPPGSAALVGMLPESGLPASISTYYLVTEGHRYALSSSDVIADLGYAAKDVTALPAGILGFIPTGPILDPTKAQQTIPMAGQPSAPSVVVPTTGTG
jgi:type VII secretion protein EccB